MPGVFGEIDGSPFLGAGGRVRGFLFDENLPHRLIFTPTLSVVPTGVLGKSPSDAAIWNHARNQSLIIVTKDADFSDRIM
jgi:predicted nuclease of predicted toxin-antitoxin system